MKKGVCITIEFDQEIFDVFTEEFENLLVILKNEITNARTHTNINVNEIFRVFHTLKGNSATLEFKRLEKLTNTYCEYFRPRQNARALKENEFIALKKCYQTLKLFLGSIKNGRKGKRVKIAPVMKLLS